MSISLNPLQRKKHLIISQYDLFSRIYEGNISVMCSMESEILEGATWTINQVRLYHLHRPDIHFGPILPVSEQLRGRVGRTSTLGVEELQRQRFSLQSVAQAEVCARYNLLFCADVLDSCNRSYLLIFHCRDVNIPTIFMLLCSSSRKFSIFKSLQKK